MDLELQLLFLRKKKLGFRFFRSKSLILDGAYRKIGVLVFFKAATVHAYACIRANNKIVRKRPKIDYKLPIDKKTKYKNHE